MRRRIAIVTGTRAEYGLLLPVIRRVRADPGLKLQLLVTGSHLSRAHGMTVREIERDGLPIAARVDLRLSGDDARATADALARGVSGFARAFARLRPDVLVVLGDRYEILAAAAAALPFGLPVAHIHGGESSEGVWDESVRHAVTKLSHLHFPAAPLYARRLALMGENPRRIVCAGSPGWDRIREIRTMSRAELEKDLGLSLRRPLVAATFHPATLEADRGLAQCRALLSALDRLGGVVVFSYPNADAGGGAIKREILAYVRRHPSRAVAVPSLGQRRYFSLLRHADAMAGNSSSGLLEAPFFRLPVVNLGERQKGRLRGSGVLDVPRPTASNVLAALRRAISPAFRRRLPAPPPVRRSPSETIVRVLKTVELNSELLKKSFHGL